MSAQLSIASADFAPEDIDRVAREFQADIAALSRVNLQPSPHRRATGVRGDPVTVGTIVLAMVTSGTVTALFNIIKSYIERGIDFTFEGTDADGKSVKLQMKGVSLVQFRELLKALGVLK